MKKLLTLSIVLCSFLPSYTQPTKSTKDLSFLVGTWDVVRTYSPETDQERVLKGTLVCEESMDGTFIHCRYEIERPNKIRGIDEVYFNYNKIYDTYESLWLSSTWPIKVLMQGDLAFLADQRILSTEASFEIENGVMEYVKGKLVIDASAPNSFSRETHIRTSEYEEGVWRHHMTEEVRRRKN